MLHNYGRNGRIPAMSPRSKDTRLRLLEPLATDFAAFRAAIGLGATEIGIVRDAVRAFIDARISKDDDLRARFEAERDRLSQRKTRTLKLVKSEPESGG